MRRCFGPLAQAATTYLLVVLSGHAFAGDTQAEQGRALFEGKGNASAVSALINGRPGNAALLRCSSCHGRDGLGRAEADAVAPAIIRGVGGLDRPGISSSGIIRPAYDAVAFLTAVRHGVDPNGRTLSARMPRYEVEGDQAMALWNWLEALPKIQQSGVKPDALNFGLWMPSGREEQRVLLAQVLQKMSVGLGPRFGRGIVWKIIELPDEHSNCERIDVLLLAVAGIGDDHNSLEVARRCSLPVILPFDVLAGNEAADEVRGMRAPLASHWDALVAAIDGNARVLFPAHLETWQKNAAQLANLNRIDVGADKSAASAMFVPFGLDGVKPPSKPAIVYAPAIGSMESLSAWYAAGHELRLSFETGIAPASGNIETLKVLIERLVSLVDKASVLAGPMPTRASIIEAIDELEITGTGAGKLDYRSHRLTGTSAVEVRIFNPDPK